MCFPSGHKLYGQAFLIASEPSMCDVVFLRKSTSRRHVLAAWFTCRIRALCRLAMDAAYLKELGLEVRTSPAISVSRSLGHFPESMSCRENAFHNMLFLTADSWAPTIGRFQHLFFLQSSIVIKVEGLPLPKQNPLPRWRGVRGMSQPYSSATIPPAPSSPVAWPKFFTSQS